MAEPRGFRTLKLRPDDPTPGEAAQTRRSDTGAAPATTAPRPDATTETAPAPTPRQVIEAIAAGIARTSPAWQDHLQATALIDGRTDPNVDALLERLPGPIAFPVQVIYEGYLMHEGRSRVLKLGASESVRLLIGDYCHAAGIAELADAGQVDLVDAMAATIARTSTAPAGERDAEWIDTLDAIIGGRTPSQEADDAPAGS